MRTSLGGYASSGSASGRIDLPDYASIATVNGIIWTGEGTLTISATGGQTLYTQTNTNLHTSGSALYNELQSSGAPLYLDNTTRYSIVGAYKGFITWFGFVE